MDPDKLTLASLDARLKKLEAREANRDTVPIFEATSGDMRVFEEEEGYLYIYVNKDAGFGSEPDHHMTEDEALVFLDPANRQALKDAL